MGCATTLNEGPAALIAASCLVSGYKTGRKAVAQ